MTHPHDSTSAHDTSTSAHDTSTSSSSSSSAAAASRPSRRTVLASVGLAGAGVTALAACGAAGNAASSASDAAGSAAGAAKQAISKATIPVGGGKIFSDQKVVVTQPTAGDFKAFSAVCTHQACLVDTVADGTISCPCHGSRFDITTGAVTQGPATQPLPEKTISVSGDGITIT